MRFNNSPKMHIFAIQKVAVSFWIALSKRILPPGHALPAASYPYGFLFSTLMLQTPCTQNLRPISDTLEVVGGKWKLLILSALVGIEAKRFTELQRELGRVTPRVLSKELKELELNQLIERKVYATTPVTVEYSLSEHGKTLEPVMLALRDWGTRHRRQIMHRGEQTISG